MGKDTRTPEEKKIYNAQYYQAHKAQIYANTKAWRAANPELLKAQWDRRNGAYYRRVESETARRAVALFQKMSDDRRTKFAIAIMNKSTRNWSRAMRDYALDEWLGAYSGI